VPQQYINRQHAAQTIKSFQAPHAANMGEKG
jgi:hypothetical protein